MGSACRTAPHPRKYPSLSALSTSIPLFGLEPLLRSCRRSQHLVVSTISLHVISIPTSLHVDSIHSCGVIPSHRPHTFMSTSYFHVHLVLSCRPSYLYVDPNISSCRHRLPSLTVNLSSSLRPSLSCRTHHQVYHRCQPSISSMSAKYIINVDQVYHR